jgi:methylthioribose-1-phosphate isomerase
MIVQAVKWIGDIDGYLELIDQRRLPAEFTKLQCRDVETLFDAIETLAVRGAPAIGVSAAYGLTLALQKLNENESIEKALESLAEARDYLASSRPTAVNLFWALDRVCRTVGWANASFVHAERSRVQQVAHPTTLKQLREIVLREANAIYQEDVAMCRRIGEHGEKFIKDGAGILTHCNAGALATAGQGTALSPMFEAHKKGKKFKVYVDETRPLLQGARLTAWELKQAGIDVMVICDNMAGWLMKQGKINIVITGADRIAANGDTANKIGTYSLAVLAKEHDIPFYVAAPTSTIDPAIASGDEILIEERDAEEVTHIGGVRIAPEGVNVINPAFDVTPHRYITAIITARGIIRQPFGEGIGNII